MIRNLVQYQKQAYGMKGLFIYKGTEALKKGHAMCFDLAHVTTSTGETATDSFGARGLKVIAKPTIANAKAFAGVLTQDYPARSSGLQQVELWLPGSVCPIAARSVTTINSTILHAIAGSGANGCFASASGKGLLGRGAALALQTKAAAAGGIIGESLDGTCSFATATGTITDDDSAGLFANAAVGDKVIVVAGEGATVGEYTITEVTDDDNVIVDSLTVASNTGKIAIYVVSGNPTVLAYLYDGNENGMMDFITPTAAGDDVPMASGLTIGMGGITIASDDVPELADGTYVGQRKAFLTTGVLTTGDLLVTPDTAGVQLDGSTALNTLELDGANDYSLLEWLGAHWKLIANSGTALA